MTDNLIKREIKHVHSLLIYKSEEQYKIKKLDKMLNYVWKQ